MRVNMGGNAIERDFCTPCAKGVRGLRPPWSAKLCFALGLGGALTVMGVSLVLGWAVFFAAPILGAVGLCIGPLAASAFREPTCPHCGRIVVAATVPLPQARAAGAGEVASRLSR